MTVNMTSKEKLPLFPDDKISKSLCSLHPVLPSSHIILLLCCVVTSVLAHAVPSDGMPFLSLLTNPSHFSRHL